MLELIRHLFGPPSPVLRQTGLITHSTCNPQPATRNL